MATANLLDGDRPSKDQDWRYWLNLARDLDDRGSIAAANMADWIEEHQHVTPRQKEALESIAGAFER